MRSTRKKTVSQIVVKEDLFQAIEKDYSCSTTNNILILVPHICSNGNAFNSLFAKQVLMKYPIVEQNYAILDGKSFGHSQFVSVKKTSNKELLFVNMISQDIVHKKPNHRTLSYAALVKCMYQVHLYIQDYKSKKEDLIVEIHTPKNNRGVQWNLFSELIEDMWSSYNCYIHI